MYEITYCSSARPDLRAEDISDILETAQQFNSENDITGCLLYHNQEFVQILEGDKDILQRLYSKITQDKRHTHVMLLSEGTKKERVFSDWSMAFHELGSDEVRGIGSTAFVDNMITFSQLAEKPTFPTFLFWNGARQLLERSKLPPTYHPKFEKYVALPHRRSGDRY